MKLRAHYVTVSDFDDQYFQVSFDNEHPAADYDPDALMRPYVLLQRQFEDADGGVCYLETHDADRYAGNLKFRLSNSPLTASPSRLTGPKIDWWKLPSGLADGASERYNAS